MEVVAQKGLQAATVRAVAEAADMSVGLLHHYFTNKEEMILAVLEFTVARYTSDLEDRISDIGPAIESFREIRDWFLAVNDFDIKLLRNMDQFQSFSIVNPAIAEALTSLYQLGRDLFVELIEKGIKTGEFKKVDPIVTSAVLLASFAGTIRLWLLDPENTPMDEIGKELETIFLGYLVK